MPRAHSALAPRRAVRSLAYRHLIVVLIAALLGNGCDREPKPLSMRELTRDENNYVSRFIVLERAKAALLATPETGTLLCDSLALAWGDSALADTRDLAPDDPARAARVNELLRRVLAAEHDSLLTHGGRRPLSAPMPVPADTTAYGR